MISRVIVSKQLIAQFRKAAIAAYPLEHLMTVWGKLAGDTVVVSAIRPVQHTATADRVDYHVADAVVPTDGAHFLGSIHSHPGEGVDGAPSCTDWINAYTCGEIICAVMTVAPSKGKFKTETRWWEPRPEIAMIHPRIRNAKTKDKAVQLLQEVQSNSLSNVRVPAVSGSVEGEA